MIKVVTSYSTKEYYKSLDLLEKTSIEIGKADKFVKYTYDDLKDSEFFKKNQHFLFRAENEALTDSNRIQKAGYWIWKPYIILQTFEQLQENDIVMYVDAGISVIKDLAPLYKITQNSSSGVVLFKLPAVDVPRHLAKTWTKKDCFVLMKADEEKYWNTDMINGAVSLWIKNEYTINFLNEWRKYMKDPRIITGDINMCGSNYPGFKFHRYDQSIMTILAKKYNIELFCDPTQYGNSEREQFKNSPYEQLFNHHRNKL